jgi:uncharacterized membrane protein YgcG
MLVRALRLAPFAVVLGLPAFALGCAVAPQTGHNEGEGLPGERTGTTSAAITSDDAISRAEQWVTAKLLYCQSANGQPDYDTSCSSTCTRQSNPQWDPYRSDCSGFVSWAWGLPAPGLVTSEFAPFGTTASTTIQATDLQPGDACNLNAGGHIVLFEKWVTPGTSALFMEEPGCSANPPYAHEFQSDVTLSGVNITIAYEGETFTAIRYNQITESPADAGAPTEAGTPDTGSPQVDAGSSSSGSGSGSSSGSSGSGGGSGSSSGSSGGSSGSGSGGAGSSSGGSSGGTAGEHDAGPSSPGNGASASNATMDNASGGLGCDVGGMPARDGGGVGGLLLLGLAFLRKKKAAR